MLAPHLKLRFDGKIVGEIFLTGKSVWVCLPYEILFCTYFIGVAKEISVANYSSQPYSPKTAPSL